MVSWKPLGAPDNATVNGYTVSASPGTEACVTAGLVTDTCDVTGLINGIDYLFTVVADNADGNQLIGTVTATPVGESCDETPDTGFLDIDGSFAADDIACISHLGVTTGTSETTYDPVDAVSREQMAAFIARLWRTLSLETPGGLNPFEDISESFAADDIGFIFNLGITTGISETMYWPRGVVTREQMAAFLARAWRNLGGYCDVAPTPFTDTAGRFAAVDIACIYNLGITTGTSSSTYSLTQVVTRQQAAALLARLWQAATDWGL